MPDRFVPSPKLSGDSWLEDVGSDPESSLRFCEDGGSGNFVSSTAVAAGVEAIVLPALKGFGGTIVGFGKSTELSTLDRSH